MIKDKPKKIEIGIVIKQDISEKPANIVYLGIGSNLGNKKNNIEKTKYLLETNSIKILKSSNFYETFSWPDKSKPKFYNVVIKVITSLDPKKLFLVTKNIEKKLGRKKTLLNRPRTCDIDILDYKGQIISSEYEDNEFTIPHKKLSFRNFVLYDAASPTISLQVLFYKTHICTSIKKLKLTESLSSFGI